MSEDDEAGPLDDLMSRSRAALLEDLGAVIDVERGLRDIHEKAGSEA